MSNRGAFSVVYVFNVLSVYSVYVITVYIVRSYIRGVVYIFC
jgi:hypothetical protein